MSNQVPTCCFGLSSVAKGSKIIAHLQVVGGILGLTFSQCFVHPWIRLALSAATLLEIILGYSPVRVINEGGQAWQKSF